MKVNWESEHAGEEVRGDSVGVFVGDFVGESVGNAGVPFELPIVISNDILDPAAPIFDIVTSVSTILPP